jgi:hypothetical protein
MFSFVAIQKIQIEPQNPPEADSIFKKSSPEISYSNF